MHCFRTGVEKGMKLCTAVQEGCGYKDTLRAHRYFAPLAKYFTVCITYQPVYVIRAANLTECAHVTLFNKIVNVMSFKNVCCILNMSKTFAYFSIMMM